MTLPNKFALIEFAKSAAPCLCILLISGLISGAAPAQELEIRTSFAEFGTPEYATDFPHFDYVNPHAPAGGAINLGAGGTFERLDTIALGGPWAAGIGLASDVLMSGSGDEHGVYYPSIATQVAVPADLSYAIFTIHPDARWEDGRPITAGDFVYSHEAIKEYGRPLLQQFYGSIISATALTPSEIRFDFDTVGDLGVLGLAASFSPMPKHDYEARGISPGDTRLEPVLSAGGYRIVDVDPGRSISYERIEDWWAWDLPVNVGQGNFDRITYTYFRDREVMFEAFLGGDLDFWGENSSRRWATGYENVEAVDDGRIIRDAAPANQERGFVGIVFNTRREKFSDPRVREAMGYLYDYEWTRANLQYGFYERARSYFPNSDYGISNFPLPEGLELEALEPYRDQLPGHLFTTPFELPVSDGSGRIRRQLREALRLFGEAGWSVVDAALVNDETGQQMQVELLLGSEILVNVLQPFIENLKSTGIDAAIRVVDTSQYERLTDDFEYDLVYLAANFFPPPGEELRTYFLSDEASRVGSANWAGMENPVVDALLTDIVAAHEEFDRLQATTRALDRVLLWNHYMIPSYFPDESWFAHWDRFGRPDRYPHYGIGFTGTWWVDAERDAALPR